VSKVYRGFNHGGHTASPRIITVSDGTEVALLEHRVRHSPTGMSWGYSGSGPADLALSILWDYLGEEPTPDHYQVFKEGFVALWPQDKWVLDSSQLDKWVSTYRSTIGPPTVREAEEAISREE
jgi:hypothetical protein